MIIFYIHNQFVISIGIMLLHFDIIVYKYLTVNSSSPVCVFFLANISSNIWWIPIKYTSPWTGKLYLSSLTACRLLDLLYQNVTHTKHDTGPPSVLMISVLCFDTVIVVHCDVTDTKSRDQLSLDLWAQNTAHWSSVQMEHQCHVQYGWTFHKGDIEVWKQLNWIGIILVLMMICIVMESVDYLWNNQRKMDTLEMANWL